MDNSVEKPKWLNVLFISSKGTTTCCTPYVFDEERWALFFFLVCFPIDALMRRTSSSGALRQVLCLTKSVLLVQEFQFPTENCVWLCPSVPLPKHLTGSGAWFPQLQSWSAAPGAGGPWQLSRSAGKSHLRQHQRKQERWASAGEPFRHRWGETGSLKHRHLVPYFLNSWAVFFFVFFTH